MGVFEVDGEGEMKCEPLLEGCFTCRSGEDVEDEGLLGLGISALATGVEERCESVGEVAVSSGSAGTTGAGSTLSLKPGDTDVRR
jgi:hypothetical protein